MTEYLLEVPVHPVSYSMAVARVRALVMERRHPAAFIVQTNVNTLVNTREDPAYLHILKEADLSLPDGMPLVWLIRLRGRSPVCRVYGPDLMLKICKTAAIEGWRCVLVGGAPGVPERVQKQLETLFPKLCIAGTFSPPFHDQSERADKELVAKINHLRPDVVWVALGGQKQDTWMFDHRKSIQAPVMHGVGAAFDFLSGNVPQAPKWMMNVGLEWLFRLMAEPGRLWRRYTVKNAKFVYYVLRYEFLSAFLDRLRKKSSR